VVVVVLVVEVVVDIMAAEWWADRVTGYREAKRHIHCLFVLWLSLGGENGQY